MRKHEIVALFAIVVLAAILRLVNLGYYSLRYDEICVVRYEGTESLGEMFEVMEKGRGGTPLFGMMVAPLIRRTHSELVLGFPLFLFGVASVLATFYLGRRIFNTQVGLTIVAKQLAGACLEDAQTTCWPHK